MLRDRTETDKGMSRDTFWALIQEAKAACDQDMDAMEEYLCGALVRMGPAAARGFHNILHAYEDLAYQYGLWDAASVIKEYGCSDDALSISAPGSLPRAKTCI